MVQILKEDGEGVIRELEKPYSALKYAALSPITFRSPEELQAKMKTYIQKNTKPGKFQTADTSKANKMFYRENPARSSFEHQR